MRRYLGSVAGVVGLVLAVAGCDGTGASATLDTTPPRVLFTSPVDGAQAVSTRAVIVVTFDEAIDPATVISSSFSLRDSAGAPVAATVVGGTTGGLLTPAAALTPGSSYTATVSTEITDRAGNPLSAPVSWTFVVSSGGDGVDNTPPQLLFTSPPEGGRAVPLNTRIAVAFNEEIEASTLNDTSFTLVDEGGVPVAAAVAAAGPGGTLTPSAALSPDTTYTATVTTAIADRAGNPLSSPLSWTFHTASAPDTSAPTVVLTVPFDDQQQVVRGGRVWVVFDEAIDPSTLSAASFQLWDPLGNPVAGTVTPFSNGASFTPSFRLGLTWSYRAVVSTAVTDLAGNSLAADYMWSFHVEPGDWGTAGPIEFDNAGNAALLQVTATVAGGAIAVWRQANASNYYRVWTNGYTVGGGWGTPEMIPFDIFGSVGVPQVAIDSAGNAVAVCEQTDGTRSNVWANRYTAGVGWGNPELLEHDDTGGAFNPQVTFDRADNAIAVWRQSDGVRYNTWANRYVAGVGWGSAELIEVDDAGDTQPPSRVAIDATGNATVVWSQSDGVLDSIWANRYEVGVGWGTAELIEVDNAWDAQAPQVAVDPGGNAIAVWVSNSTVDSAWANRYEVGVGWGTAERIDLVSRNVQISPQVAVDATGNAIAVWAQAESGQTEVRIWANRYEVGVGWGRAELIEPGTTGTAGNDSANPRVAVDPLGNGVVVWNQRVGSLSSIYANRYLVGVGWGTAELIEFDASDAVQPQLAMDEVGSAIVVWRRFEAGSIYSVWANTLE